MIFESARHSFFYGMIIGCSFHSHNQGRDNGVVVKNEGFVEIFDVFMFFTRSLFEAMIGNLTYRLILNVSHDHTSNAVEFYHLFFLVLIPPL